jgi:nitrite reductase/ring-hydroxylating ferredoxin subunit
MATGSDNRFLRVAPLEELDRKGVIVVTAGERPVAVFAHEGKVAAVDNRCPHMGFPLHQGSVKDGLLTCHWHEARFDLCNGCTFDLWADDVPSYESEIRDGVVYVAQRPRQPEDRAYHERRLRHGLEHNISLIQAKAILGLRKTGAEWTDIAGAVALYGAENHDDWNQGMTLLAIVGRLLPYLSRETAYFALARASRQVAADCAQAVPHRRRAALEDGEHSAEKLTRWMRRWIACRHRDGAERVLLTGIERLGNSPALAELVFTASSDRVYSQTGHVYDGANKALELLDSIGWEHAAAILPLVLERMAMARGAEENAHWHHPVEVIEPLRAVEAELDGLLCEGQGKAWEDNGEFVQVLLGDDPLRIIDALRDALRAGAAPLELSKRVAYAAGLRLARFALSNEVADWFNARHTFIFANAVHQTIQRSASAGVVRNVFHAALSVYMDRFLNVPPARLPDDRDLEALPQGAGELCKRLLATLDRQAEVAGAAAIVARYLRLGHPVPALIDTLALATVREDLDFHALQVLEAGAAQYGEWPGRPEGEHILVGVARQLAAHCPTPRAAHQMATIAVRLERGEKMYEEEPVS